jgi:shikimate dehydrogenase
METSGKVKKPSRSVNCERPSCSARRNETTGLGFELWVSLAYNRRVSESEHQPIDARTRYCAVYGHPVRHSASPAMQNAGLNALGLNWRYLAFDVPPDDLPQAIAGAAAMRFLGLNLTLPHKVLALKLVDQLDESGRLYGAINTIRFEARDAAGAWKPLGTFDPELVLELRSAGFNTDAEAITKSLQADLDFKADGRSILLLGAGGAGLMAGIRLAAQGAKQLYIVNRTAAKAEEIIRQIGIQQFETKPILGYPPGPVDLVLNATSLGLKPEDPLPLDVRQFPLARAGAVYDMIYRPAETVLLKTARAAGCRVANGLGMLLHQGAKALELWTGQPAPVEVMRQALERSIYGR